MGQPGTGGLVGGRPRDVRHAAAGAACGPRQVLRQRTHPRSPQDDVPQLAQIAVSENDLVLQYGARMHIFQSFDEEQFQHLLFFLTATDRQRDAMLKAGEREIDPLPYGPEERQAALSRYRCVWALGGSDVAGHARCCPLRPSTEVRGPCLQGEAHAAIGGG